MGTDGMTLLLPGYFTVRMIATAVTSGLTWGGICGFDDFGTENLRFSARPAEQII